MTDVFPCSRGISSPLGKCDEQMKTLVPEAARLEFQRIAASVGASEAELLRDAVFKVAFGMTYVEHCAHLRSAVFGREGALSGLNRAGIGEKV